MNDENEIFNRIKASLDRASSVLDIKNKIEEEIYKIVKKLEDFTHNKIEILIKQTALKIWIFKVVIVWFV